VGDAIENGGNGDARPTLAQRIPAGVLHDSDAILDRFLAWVADTGIEPYPAQEEALLELMTGRHVILSTPTGSGKSLVALGLHFKAMCEERRSFYTAPVKALVSEKFFALCEQFGAEQVGMLTGDASINRDAPIVCCTAEILANMALDQGEDVDAPYVVMDEFHYYDDRERGMAWQLPLLVLRRTRFLLMSATLGDTGDIEQHIEDLTGASVSRVHSEERPVPLDFAYVETPLHETVEQLLAARKAPIYIVHFTQRDAAEQAQALTSAAISSKDEKRAIADALVGFRFDSPYGKDMRRFLQHGIGLHHAGLLPKYRLLVERLAQQGLLKIICGTDTLGVGVNIPIRCVLFSKLCKFDGEKVGILTVRDFRQISGRAGRKGFDEQGSVVVQAPEHVIENKRLTLKAAAAGSARKKKFVKKKPPTKGFVPFNEGTLEKLRGSLPEALTSRFRVGQALIVGCLRGTAPPGLRGPGYGRVIDLIERSHEDARNKRRLLREAARQFRMLRSAGIVGVERDPDGRGPRVRVSEELQRDFSLHHSLSLYLLQAVEALDPDRADYELDLLSFVESILENPRPILFAQERKARGELIGKLKAEGVPYDERMAKVEDVSWPKPNAELIYASFNQFREKHPWLREENIRPKSIARDMFESYSTFDDYVRRCELARVEGLLLRYLSQVHNTLLRSVPETARNEGVDEILGYLHTLLARVDSSLLEEWEEMVSPGSGTRAQERPEAPAAPRLDERVFRARVRSELYLLLRCLADKRYEEATQCVKEDREDPWDAARFEDALALFYEEYARILFDPRARQAHLSLIKERGPRQWDVHQTLCDDQGEDIWKVEAEIHIDSLPLPDGPLLRIRRIGP